MRLQLDKSTGSLFPTSPPQVRHAVRLRVVGAGVRLVTRGVRAIRVHQAHSATVPLATAALGPVRATGNARLGDVAHVVRLAKDPPSRRHINVW